MVDLLRVDVQAVDNDGHPVSHLTLPTTSTCSLTAGRDASSRPSSFAIRADDHGRARRRPSPIRTPGRIPEDGRLYVIAVDQSAFSTGALGQVRQALQQFINQLRVEDMVGSVRLPVPPARSSISRTITAPS